MVKERNRTNSTRRQRARFLTSPVLLVGGTAVLGAIVLAALYFATSGDDPPRRPLRTEPVVTDEMQVDVVVDNTDYTPRDLTVRKGATVTWVFKDDVPHNVVDDRGAFDSGTLQKGDTWSLRADTPGTFYYYCTLHHVMQGTLTVVE
jgi:plastocyanin